MSRTGPWSVMTLWCSAPPPLAAKGAQKATFQAAIAQATELWEAAGTISPAVKPITLFYGLTQAARAIVAARIVTKDGRADEGHGLTNSLRALSVGTTPALSDLTVRSSPTPPAKKLGLFAQVSALLGSPTIPADVTLDELISSLPASAELLFISAAARPLEVAQQETQHGGGLAEQICLVIGPVPLRLQEGVDTEHGPRMRLLTEEELTGWFAKYPKLRDFGTPKCTVMNPGFSMDPSARAWVSFPAEKELTYQERWQRAVGVLDMDQGNASGLVFPSLGTNTDALHPLMAWWAVLYGCSMLARYYPPEWVAMLDVNASRDAVPLELLLDAAHEQVPVLLAKEIQAAYR